MTRRVIIFEENSHWVLPSHMGLAHYNPGSEPVLIESMDGNVYLKSNAVIVTDL